MKKKDIICLIAVIVAVVAIVTAIIVFRKQIAAFLGGLKEKVLAKKESGTEFTPEEFEDFADI